MADIRIHELQGNLIDMFLALMVIRVAYAAYVAQRVFCFHSSPVRRVFNFQWIALWYIALGFTQSETRSSLEEYVILLSVFSNYCCFRCSTNMLTSGFKNI